MTTKPNTTAVPGWIGGFAQSNTAFSYPDPNLTSLPMLDNMANITLLKRQQKVNWPEFSWETKLGQSDSRCFSRFAQDISSIGYDDIGRIYSIICPQQGVILDGIGAMNVEVTVTGQRGWVDEADRQLAANMTVEGKIWFSPSTHQHWWIQLIWDEFKKKSLPFPYNKENAIKISTHAFQDPSQPIFSILDGASTLFNAPDFAKHTGELESWTVNNIEVTIGDVMSRNHETVDIFNQNVVDLFNQASGNMLGKGNTLTWNLWLTAPEIVSTEQWKLHADRWRHSIDVDHGKSPSGSIQTPPRYANGEYFEAPINKKKELEEIFEIIKSLL
jgi:hypothetical protein